MKRKLLLFPMMLVFLMSVTSCNFGKADLTIWVDSKIADLMRNRIKDFRKANPDFKYSFRVDTVAEEGAARNMITDVQNGADIYIFAQDQFARLISAGALSAIPTSTDPSKDLSKDIETRNNKGSVEAVKHEDEKGDERLYAYPVTSDNGYFLYYDKSVFPDKSNGEINDNIKTFDGMIKTCEAKKKQMAFCIKGGFWYGAGFFFSSKINPTTGEIIDGPLCHSDWITNSSGQFIDFDDNFKEKGLFALKAMNQIYSSDYWLDSGNADNLGVNGAAVVCSGVWDYNVAKERVGGINNLGITKLPTFTIDGDSSTYQLGSFSGYKLMGVKPHEDPKKAYWCAQLANYLTNEDTQEALFDSVGWGPSNIKAKEYAESQDAPQLKALDEQNKYAVSQGLYPNDWWSIGEEVICAQLKTKNVPESQLKELLNKYQSRIEMLVEK